MLSATRSIGAALLLLSTMSTPRDPEEGRPPSGGGQSGPPTAQSEGQQTAGISPPRKEEESPSSSGGQSGLSTSNSEGHQMAGISPPRSGDNDNETRMLDLVSQLLGSYNSKMRQPETRMVATSTTYSPGFAPKLTPATPPKSIPLSPANPDGRVPRWERIAILAESKLSTVFLCKHLENGKTFVAKTVLAHDLEARTAIEIERRMYRGYKPVTSTYFPKYLGFNIEKNCKEMNNHEVCNLFLERIALGSLYQYVHRQKDPLQESLICAFCRDILHGLSYLHRQSKIHGDIKASNVLVGMACLQLCDLGSGKIIGDGDVIIPPKKGLDPKTRCIFTTGSDGFRAPEVEEGIDQGTAADIYALGCTLVEIATGSPPQRCPRLYVSSVCNEPISGYPRHTVDLPAYFSDEAFDFLESCLAEAPNNRPSADALLRHAWLKKFPSFYGLGTLLSNQQLTPTVLKSPKPPSSRLPPAGS